MMVVSLRLGLEAEAGGSEREAGLGDTVDLFVSKQVSK